MTGDRKPLSPPVVRPARSFSFPHEVVEDPSLSTSEKREVLAEWASDACAVESIPILRWLPGTTFPVTYSAIVDARQALDRIAARERETQDRRAASRVVIANFAKRRYGSRTTG